MFPEDSSSIYVCVSPRHSKMTAVVQTDATTVAANREAAVGFTEQEKIEVKNVGTTVWLQNNVYSRTNHYIKESRNYVPEELRPNLHQYAYLVGLHWVVMVVFVIGLISPAYYIFAFIMGGVSIVFILVYAQHMHVVRKTIPIMLRLPHLPDHQMRQISNRRNDFFEITLEKYTAIFAATSDEAAAVAVKGSNKVKIHVLSAWARNAIRSSRMLSIVQMCMLIFLFFYCFAMGGFRTWQQFRQDTSET